MLCDFACSFPKFVADFIERGRPLKRRFREETLTDMMMAALVPLKSQGIIVEFPDETVTGADMEWNFVQSDGTRFFRILIQAKQLYGRGRFWTRHYYRELLYRPDPKGKLQAEILASAARTAGKACYPLYVLYNPISTCLSAALAGKRGLEGVNLADGYIIEAMAKKATTRTLRTRYKSLGTIYPLLFSLRDLFCPPSSVKIPIFAYASKGTMQLSISHQQNGTQLARITPPTPDDIRRRLSEILDVKNLHEDIRAMMPNGPILPPVAESVPQDVLGILRRAKEEPTESEEMHLDRWRITFISSPPDPGSPPE